MPAASADRLSYPTFLSQSPDGQLFKSRQAVVSHFGLDKESTCSSKDEQDEDDEPKPAVKAPVYEPPPVETEVGLAFEVARILDVRFDETRRGNCHHLAQLPRSPKPS